MKYCNKCGTEIKKETAKFCPSCGDEIDNMNAVIDEDQNTLSDDNEKQFDTNSVKEVENKDISTNTKVQESDLRLDKNIKNVMTDSDNNLINNENELPDKENTGKGTFKIKKPLLIVLIIIALGIIAVAFFTIIYPKLNIKLKYNSAVSAFENGQYEQAYNEFIDLGNYEDSHSKSIQACNGQLKKILSENFTDKTNRKIWLIKCLANEEIKEQTHNDVAAILSQYISNGETETVFEFIMDDIREYSTVYREQGYQLATMLVEQKEYDKAQQVINWINDMSYKETQALANECKYQQILEKMKSDPEAVILELYELGKNKYKDSRELLGNICTSQWIYGKLKLPSISTTNIVNEKYSFDGFIPSYTFGLKFTIASDLSIPVEGEIQATVWLQDEGYAMDSTTRKVKLQIDPNQNNSVTITGFKLSGEGGGIVPKSFQNGGFKVFYHE